MLTRIVKKYVVPHKENNFRPFLLRTGGMLLVLVFVVGAFVASNVYRGILVTNDFIASVLPAVLVDLANADRTAFALRSLSINPALEKAARLKAEDMAAKSYFAHYSPLGVSPWHWFGEAGYTFVYAGENLAIQFDDSAAVNIAWMNSPTHRANILSTHFTEIGIAAARGIYQGQETLFVVQMFGSPAQKAASLLGVQRVSSVSGKPPAPTLEESALVPVASSSVLGATSKETFVAVQDSRMSAVPPAVRGEHAVAYASLLDHVISSPTTLLAIVYTFITVLLLLVLLSVLFTRHDRKPHHVLSIFILLLIIAGLYYSYRAFVLSKINVLDSSTPVSQQ